MNDRQFLPNAILKYKLKIDTKKELIDKLKLICKKMPKPNFKIKTNSVNTNNKWYRKKFTNNIEKKK